jgi:hypothetical protein
MQMGPALIHIAQHAACFVAAPRTPLPACLPACLPAALSPAGGIVPETVLADCELPQVRAMMDEAIKW